MNPELPTIKANLLEKEKSFYVHISSQSQAELRHLEVFVRWADVVILVYSITDKASFHLAVQLLQQVQFYLNVLGYSLGCCTGNGEKLSSS